MQIQGWLARQSAALCPTPCVDTDLCFMQPRHAAAAVSAQSAAAAAAAAAAPPHPAPALCELDGPCQLVAAVCAGVLVMVLAFCLLAALNGINPCGPEVQGHPLQCCFRKSSRPKVVQVASPLTHDNPLHTSAHLLSILTSPLISSSLLSVLLSLSSSCNPPRDPRHQLTRPSHRRAWCRPSWRRSQSPSRTTTSTMISTPLCSAW